ncbi:N-acetylmuramoyl-L-alanine amidase [Anaeromicropila populeti]|uniref:N-acetylmuramoyl-L-alanine amidase n=1 Tax=Anaeromicropila populeti TaxID=37658 RepID=A0A1I6LRJ1_9FIRM|nr:N-acetylmuramoyl-L-alanine amidase [Anaeromicropila populeti]SFS06117.1 LysM domain-containing protein [Anaeromicropila populeti]
MRVIKQLCTKSDCYKAGKSIEVKGIMLHSVGCPQPKASVFLEKWNKPGVSSCVHGIVEPDGTVYQLLPWNHRGWHGGGASNDTHIGIEMTEPSTIHYTKGAEWIETGNGEITRKHVLATYQTAVTLLAALCEEYHLNPIADGVILSHAEGYQRGIASHHGDVEHIWTRFGLTMEQFRNDVKQRMGKKDSSREKETVSSLRIECYGRLKREMCIREGTSIKEECLTTYKKGAFVEVVSKCENGWLQIRCKESTSGYGYVSNVKSAYVSLGSEVYTVQKGDSLWRIAEDKLGKGIYYTKIKTLNGLTSDILSKGFQLLIP